jgi:hypothetical protein
MRKLMWIAVVITAAACSKASDSDKAGSGAGSSAGAIGRDGVLAAWTSAKLAPANLAPASVAFAKDCQGGTVEGIDVLVCNFASPAEAKAAEAQGLGWVGLARPRRGAGRARGSQEDRSERQDDQPADEAGAEVAVSIACRPWLRRGRRWPTKRWSVSG